MSRRTHALAMVAGLMVLGVLSQPVSAQAAAVGGDSHGGTITVGASDIGPSGGVKGGGTNGGGGGSRGRGQWLCVYTKLVLNDGGGFAPGGPTPGSWYSVTCINQATGASTTETEWIADKTTKSTPPVDPYAVAREAESSLHLPSPATHTDPAAFSVVNLATWLWIDAAIWHPYSVTATVGPVSATAVATPVSVTWSMGDGGVITCSGPGTAFDPAEPSTQQSTDCSYVYVTSSAGQPSVDGQPDQGAFPVVATVHWSVTWSAAGAAGGGELPPLPTSTSTAIRVEQVQSVSAEAPGGN